ncbi:MAG TPA: hypothetical protein VK014_09120 [Cyclobacteriaceae bacterium]|nr:hypothetical protein [Cyclobacteriaceae bacterium]
MYNRLPGRFYTFLFKAVPFALAIAGCIVMLVWHFFFSGSSMPIVPAPSADLIKVPFDFFDLGIYQYLLEVDNYVLFEHFESLPPQSFPGWTTAFGISIWLAIVIGLVLVSLFNRMQFVLSMGLIIFLLTLTGVNGLNIGGISNNMPTIILMVGLILPAAIVHTFYSHWGLGKRTAVILPIALLTLPLLLGLGEAVNGALLLAENLSLFAMAVTGLFMLYTGHVVISSVYVLLAKLNKGVGLKISWHITVISILYLLFFLFLLLRITGNFQWDAPIPPVRILFLIVGVLGYFETKRKIEQFEQPYVFSAVGEGLYLLGFAISALTFWKAELSANQPMLDFLEHTFIYSQLAFGLLFYAYLMANFGSLMNQGSRVETVLFKPKFFAYYHMRIGAMLALLSIIVFADGIVGVQVNAASTNISADYYYATGRHTEASILYEHSWESYRRNAKAGNTVAHLALLNKQPTAAVNTLLRNFDNAPSVNDVLLLAGLLQENGNESGAFSVLEGGLALFPNNPYLLNNMAFYYSDNGRAEEAFQLLESIRGSKNQINANKVALQAKHLVRYDEQIKAGTDQAGKVNTLAFANLKGDDVPFSLATDVINDTDVLSRAILRNQWSYAVGGDLHKDIALIDTLLAKGVNATVEEELRQTRVIRSLKQDYINESLKRLNGLAYQFPNAAAKYHFMAANILIGQLDFEKAAIELMQAEEKGFDNFKTEHLPILYYGGRVGKAFEVSSKHNIEFPSWMRFDEQASLAPNDTTLFFSGLSKINTMVKAQFMAHLDSIQSEKLKPLFAYQLLLRKAHWLQQEEIRSLVAIAESHSEKTRFEHLVALKTLLREDTFNEDQEVASSLPLDRNAYWTPMVFKAMEKAEGNLEKYNILVEASNFNKDPLLWINLVKYSRLVGVDHYTSSILSQMSEWVDAETLVELQLEIL